MPNLAHVVSTLLIAGTAVAQEPTARESVRARVERGEPLWAIEWRVDDQGQLNWRSRVPTEGDLAEWQSLAWTDVLANIGMPGWINAFLAGPRDLASLTDAETYFAMRGVETTAEALRARILAEVTEPNPGLARRAELERILAVRLLAEQHGMGESDAALREMASDGRTDRFLRQALRDAMGTARRANPIGIPKTALQTLPTDADLIWFFDESRIPPLYSLPHHTMKWLRQVSNSALLEWPNQFPPEMLAIWQMRREASPLLPSELAHRYGNARVDWILGAVRADPGGPRGTTQLSLWAAGLFETERLHHALESQGTTLEDGILRGEGLGPMWLSVEMDAEQLHVFSPGFERADGGQPDLRATQRLGVAPVWIHLPGSSMQAMGIPVSALAMTLEVDFTPHVTLLLRSEHELAEQAQDMAALMAGVRAQAERSLQAMEPGSDVDKALAALRQVQVEVDDNVCLLEVELRGVTLDDVFALLQRLNLG